MTDLYLRAAQRIAMNRNDFDLGKSFCCCYAIYEVGHGVAEFKNVFCPPRADSLQYWWAAPYDYSDQQARVLALLFMHWMVNEKETQ